MSRALLCWRLGLVFHLLFAYFRLHQVLTIRQCLLSVNLMITQIGVQLYVGKLELFQFLKCVVDEVFFSENKSWNGETGVAAGFKRRGGGGLFSQQVDIIQVS